MATFGSLWLSGRSVRDRRALVRVHTNPSPIQTHAERNAIDFCNGPNLGRKECHPTGARRVARETKTTASTCSLDMTGALG